MRETLGSPRLARNAHFSIKSFFLFRYTINENMPQRTQIFPLRRYDIRQSITRRILNRTDLDGRNEILGRRTKCVFKN